MRTMQVMLTIAVLASLAIADARFPAVGDHVSILVEMPGYYQEFKGNITGVDNLTICLNATSADIVYADSSRVPVSCKADVCITRTRIVRTAFLGPALPNLLFDGSN